MDFFRADHSFCIVIYSLQFCFHAFVHISCKLA